MRQQAPRYLYAVRRSMYLRYLQFLLREAKIEFRKEAELSRATPPTTILNFTTKIFFCRRTRRRDEGCYASQQTIDDSIRKRNVSRQTINVRHTYFSGRSEEYFLQYGTNLRGTSKEIFASLESHPLFLFPQTCTDQYDGPQKEMKDLPHGLLAYVFSLISSRVER